MNRFEGVTKPLRWLMAILLAAFLAGCGDDDDDVVLNSDKSIAEYSLEVAPGTLVAGTIDQSAMTISVIVPEGTDVTALVATFTTTGVSVKVGTTVQESGVTPNDFTNPVVYTVTAANGTTATYTVTALIPNPGPAGASPDLGTASTYGLFASSAALTLAVNSSVTGDVGLNPAGACTNCVVGVTVIGGVIHNGDAEAIQAQTDFKAAYDDAANRTLNACPITADLSDAQAACVGYTPSTPGPTYGPGLYRSTAAMTISGDITLDAGGNADAVFIFQTDGALTTATNSRVLLTGNAQARNVWWMAGSAATLGVSSQFKGTVIANGAAVSVLGGTDLSPTVVEGRLFSYAAAADLAAYATVTVPQ